MNHGANKYAMILIIHYGIILKSYLVELYLLPHNRNDFITTCTCIIMFIIYIIYVIYVYMYMLFVVSGA